MLTRDFLLVSVVAIGLVGCNQHSASVAEPLPAVRPGEIGSHLPDFSVTDLQGHTVSSADLRGKVVLIDFWATWCQPCKKEMPGYQKLVDRYGTQRLQVIGFKFDTVRDKEDPLQFARGVGVHYPLAVATNDIKQSFGGIDGLPTTMLYDRHGALLMKVVGFEYTDNFEKALKPLL